MGVYCVMFVVQLTSQTAHPGRHCCVSFYAQLVPSEQKMFEPAHHVWYIALKHQGLTIGSFV